MIELSAVIFQQSSRTPNLNLCDFWLLGYLKGIVFNGPIVSLAELKTRIVQKIHNVTRDTTVCC